MALGIAVDTVAIRLWQLANEGRWGDAVPAAGPEEALAMLRVFLYGDVVFWIPESVIAELGAHGNEALVAATNSLVDVLFMPLPVNDPDAVDDFVDRWAGRGASRKDARWLGEACHVGFMDAAVTFDLKLVRGVHGEADGLSVMTPRSIWKNLQIPAGATPRAEPASGHPLYAIKGWRV